MEASNPAKRPYTYTTARSFRSKIPRIGNELGLGWYDYGARMYSPTIGRFNSIDRFAEKYQWATPYHYTLNNPILFVDVNGDSVIVNGDQSSIESFRQLVSTASGGSVAVDVNSNTGIVTWSEGANSSPTDRQARFGSELKGILDSDGGNFTVTLAEGSEEVIIGSFDKETIDVADIAQFSSKDESSTSAGSLLIHELAEQSEKQIGGKEFQDAHSSGMAAENRVNGTERSSGQLSRFTTIDIPGIGLPQTGTYGYRVTNRNNFLPEDKAVIVHVKNSNVVRVEEKDL